MKNINSIRFINERTRFLLGAVSSLAVEMYGKEAYEEDPLDTISKVLSGLFGSLKAMCGGDSKAIIEFLEPYLTAETKSWDLIAVTGVTSISEFDMDTMKDSLATILASTKDDEKGLAN
jgi:hypothetical protein